MTQLPLNLKSRDSRWVCRDDLSTYSDDVVIREALARVAKRFQPGILLSSPMKLQEYLSLKLSLLEYEVFYVIYLDNHLRLIEMTELFRGTLNQAAVYPREVVKEALLRNAASIVVVHNHPSGVSDPSNADLHLTRELKKALQLIDVRLLDHFIVAGTEVRSLAAEGLF